MLKSDKKRMRTEHLILVVVVAVALVGLVPFIAPEDTGLQGFEDYYLSGYPYYFFTGRTFTARIIKGETRDADENTAANLIINTLTQQYRWIKETPYGEGYTQIRAFPEELRGKTFIIGDPRFDYELQNGIVIGTPCHNALVAQLLNARNCEDYFLPSEGLIKLVETKGRLYLVITGYSGKEVLATAKLLVGYAAEGKLPRKKELKTVTRTYRQALQVPSLSIGEPIGKELPAWGGR